MHQETNTKYNQEKKELELQYTELLKLKHKDDYNYNHILNTLTNSELVNSIKDHDKNKSTWAMGIIRNIEDMYTKLYQEQYKI